MSSTSPHKRRRQDDIADSGTRHSSAHSDTYKRPTSRSPTRYRSSSTYGNPTQQTRISSPAALSFTPAQIGTVERRQGFHRQYDRPGYSAPHRRDESIRSSARSRGGNYYDDVASGTGEVMPRISHRYSQGYISKDEEWASRAGASTDSSRYGRDRFSSASASRYASSSGYAVTDVIDRDSHHNNGRSQDYDHGQQHTANYRYEDRRLPTQGRSPSHPPSGPSSGRTRYYKDSNVSNGEVSSLNRAPSHNGHQATLGPDYSDERPGDYEAVRRYSDRRYERSQPDSNRYDTGRHYDESAVSVMNDSTPYFTPRQPAHFYQSKESSTQGYSRSRTQYYEDYHPPPPQATQLPSNGNKYYESLPLSARLSSRQPDSAESRQSEYDKSNDSPASFSGSQDNNYPEAVPKRRRTRFGPDIVSTDKSECQSPEQPPVSENATQKALAVDGGNDRSNGNTRQSTPTGPSKGFKKTFFKIPSAKEGFSRRNGPINATSSEGSKNGSRSTTPARRNQNDNVQAEPSTQKAMSRDEGENVGQEELIEGDGDSAQPSSKQDILREDTTKEDTSKEDTSRKQSAKPEDRMVSVYERKAQVGEGTYGKVYKAVNTISKQKVALKRIRMEFERDGFPITALREIKLLQSVRHENIVSLLEMMVEKSSVYMVFEYVDHDLSGILTHPSFVLEHKHVKHLLMQLLEGLAYLHKRGVLHRDIKGSNILLSSSGQLKIADFGLARFYNKHKSTVDYTNRVITLWYRPPELLLGATAYGAAVDIWGAGCLMIELYSRRAVFQGQDEIQQLEAIYDVMGTPTKDNWSDVDKLPWYELVKPAKEKPSRFMDMFESLLPPCGLELASQLLSLDPVKRPSAAVALQHDYFTREDPSPVRPTGLADLVGEWHEYESKQRRRKEKSHQHSSKA